MHATHQHHHTQHRRLHLVNLVVLVLLALSLHLGSQPADAMTSTSTGSQSGCIEAWAEGEPCFGGSWGGGRDDASGGGTYGGDGVSCVDAGTCAPEPDAERCPPLLRTCRVLLDPAAI